MTRLSDLIGLEEGQALRLLEEDGRACSVSRYLSYRPSEGTDSVRVVRALERGGIVELVTCEFRTVVSQG